MAWAQLSLTRVATGFERPVYVAQAPGDQRLLVVEQTGKIRVLQNGQVQAEPFLDVSGLVSCCGERGLLGLTFHPKYAENGFFFINYTGREGNTVIARYKAENNRGVAGSARIVMTIAQPYANHNGGMVEFGPDGYLYIGMGDGGAGGDPQNHGQNLGSLLGKILRIDVDNPSGNLPYGIPRDNPFVGREGVRPEIWSYGWRNPWRFSFDRSTGDMWVGDVGQNAWEEVHWEGRGKGGLNYGWRCKEGNHDYRAGECGNKLLVDAVLEYSHGDSGGCSITGGYRYRGQAVASIKGAYIYGDYCTGRIWAGVEGGNRWSAKELTRVGFQISSFGEDNSGELYVLDHGGTVYKITGR
jgi:glucose/arabinose dehydrogenase